MPSLLAAHGLLHASSLGPRPPDKPGAPRWPFDILPWAVLANGWVPAGTVL